jgi:hypothetical protein
MRLEHTGAIERLSWPILVAQLAILARRVESNSPTIQIDSLHVHGGIADVDHRSADCDVPFGVANPL